MPTTRYEELANAIVLQAVKDYRNARGPYGPGKRKKIERFFLSDWYGMLTELDPMILIKRLREEVA